MFFTHIAGLERKAFLVPAIIFILLVSGFAMLPARADETGSVTTDVLVETVALVVTDTTVSDESAPVTTDETVQTTEEAPVVTTDTVEADVVADTSSDTAVVTEETSDVVVSPEPVSEPASVSVSAPLVVPVPSSVEGSEVEPELSTDKADYYPNETASIFGKFFSAFQNIVLKIFGGEEGNDYTEITANVTSDEGGNFTYQYQLDDVFRPLYTIVASALSGEEIVRTTFTDNVGYDKGVYNKDAFAQNTTGNWTTGNAGSNYQEGQWVSYKYTIKGLNPGDPVPDFNVVFNHFQDNTRAVFIDGLANFRWCWDGPTGSCADLPDDTQYPPASWGTFLPSNINEKYVSGTCSGLETAEPFANEHCFKVTAGSGGIPSVAPATPGGEYKLRLFYTAHLTKSATWATGNGPLVNNVGLHQVTTATLPVDMQTTVYGNDVYDSPTEATSPWAQTNLKGIGSATGSSRNFKLADQSIGAQGAVTLPIPTVVAPTASLTIIKNTEPDSAQDFAFDAGILGIFNLDDDADGTLSNTKTFTLLASGIYSVSETSDPLYSTTASCSDGSPVSAIDLGDGESVTCTFVNTLATGNIIVDKVTNPVGDSQSFDFTTTGTGYAGFSLTDSATPNDQELVAGTYSVSEGAVAGWIPQGSVCVSSIGDTESAGSLELDAGETITCTFTNEADGKIIIVKDSIPDGPQDFHFTTTGDGLSAFDLDDDSDGTLSNSQEFNGTLVAGTYTVTEDATVGYDLTGLVCDDGDSTGNLGTRTATIVVSAGETVTCTFTNTEDATLTLVKTVVNNNGGGAVADDFQAMIDGGDVAWNSPQVVSVGAHTASETTLAGYSASDWGGDCAADGSVSLSPGDDKVCSITNDDQQAYITVVKIVTNDNGGNAASDDFDLTLEGDAVTSGVAVPVNPGTYTADETLLSGYTFEGFSGDCDVNGDTTVALGESKTCTLTNNDQQAYITVVKVVTNDNGGNAEPDDFNLTLEGSPALSGVATAVNPGTYTAGETLLSGYAFEGFSGACDSNGDVVVALGESKTCTLTNNDEQSYIIVDKTVINNNGGSAGPNDFLLTVDGNGVSDEVAYPVNPGIHTAGETLLSGYTAGAWGGDCDSAGSVSVALGETKTCTITNDDQQSHITVVKVVTNDNGGNAAPDDFDLTLEGSAVISGVAVPVNPGTYTAGETLLSGYTFEGFSGDCDVNGDTTVALGESKTCTLTNNDQQAYITVVKEVINDNGGTATVADFALNLEGNPVLSGVATPVNPGTYTAGETFLSGYSLVSFTDDCDGSGDITVALGESKTCTLTNDDQSGNLIVHKTTIPANDLTVFSVTINGTPLNGDATRDLSTAAIVNYEVNAGTYSVSEADEAGWDETNNTCVDLVIPNGGFKHCWITNTQRGHIIIVKDVIGNPDPTDFTFQNNFGNDNPDTFQLDEDTNITLPSTRDFEVLPGTYAVSEDSMDGWQLESATCSDNSPIGAVAVAPGETVTCTFINEELISITLVKNTVGGDGAFDFTMTGDGLPANTELTTVAGTQSQTFEGLDQDNTYSISETVPAGWDLTSATCTGGETPDDITPEPGEDVTCTFTNTADSKIIVEKVTVGGDGDFDFTTDYNAGFILSNGESNDSGDIDAGTYSVTETAEDGWDLTSAVCSDQSDPSAIDLEAGETVTCVFTNTKDSKIIVNKVTVGGDDNFAFTASYDNDGFILANGGSNDSGDLDAGIYAVSETVPAGWDLTGATCDDQSDPSEIDLAAGETVTCTFTNTKRATVIVEKDMVGGVDTFSYTGNPAGDISTDLGTIEESVVPGEYTSTEGTVAGWDLNSIVCDDNNSTGDVGSATATFLAEAGEVVTCTFTNTKRGELEVTKVLNLNGYLFASTLDASFDVVVTGPSYLSGTTLTFTVVDGVLINSPQTLDNLIPGIYSVTETDPGISWTISGNGNVNVDPGQTGTATITNDLKLPSTSITLTPNTFETTPEENVILTITDTNNGGVPITSPSVELYANDVLTVPQPTYVSGDTNTNNIMDVGETWTWTWQGIISVNTVFTVNGIGTDPLGNPVNGPTYSTETASETVRVIGTTRTLGYWQTHTSFTTAIFEDYLTLAGDNFIGQNVVVAAGTHKGILTSVAEVFGGFYAPIAKTTTGAKRSPVDQARITLLQQLLAAKLNCAAFGCSATVQGQIASADAAYAANNKNDIMSYVSILDGFNNSGDENAIPAGLPATGKATPALSKSLADIVFWNLP